MIGIGPNLSLQPAKFIHKSGASLEYDFTLGTLSPVSGNEAITFTRSTIGTAINTIGLVETFAVNRPRFNHDVNTIANQNVITRSQEFDHSDWIKTNHTVTANAATAPSGSVTMDMITASAGSTPKYTHQAFPATLEVWTFSTYAKAGTASWLFLGHGGSENSRGAYFNLATGVVGTTHPGSVATIEPLGDGIFRCKVTRLIDAAVAFNMTHEVHTADNQDFNFTAAGTETLYIWGAQANLATGHGSPELVSNGTFDTATTSWTASNSTLSVVTGRLRITQTAVGAAAIQAITCEVGKAYLASMTLLVDAITGNQFFRVGTSSGGNETFETTVTSVGGTYTTMFVATQTTHYVSISGSSSGVNAEYFDVDNVSVKELNYLPYTPTTSTAATVKYACKGLLIEEARTNLITKSEEIEHANWTQGAQTTTANQTTSPSGALTGDLLTASAGSSWKQTYQAFTGTAATYTDSIFAKVGTANWLGLTFGGTTLADGAYFDLSTGTVGTVAAGITAKIEPAGNGWYRCSVTKTLTAATYYLVATVHTADSQAVTWTAAGTETIYIWGAQAELGAFASSYIPTTTAAVTRAADVAVVSNVTPWLNQSEGTVYFEGDELFINQATTGYLFKLAGATSADLMIGYVDVSTALAHFVVDANSAGQANLVNGSVISANTVFKVASAYKLNDFALCEAGSSVSVDVSGTVPAITSMGLGCNTSSVSNQLNGHIRKFAYHPRRIADAELVMLTA